MKPLTRETDRGLQTAVVAFVGVLVVLSAATPVAVATTADPSVTFVESGIETDTT